MYRRTHRSFTLMTKLTCMILSFLLIVCVVPTITVWAEDVSAAVQAGAVSETTATPVPEVEPAAPTTGNAILSAEGVLSTDAISTTSTVTEVTSLREESIKHFKLPDGTYQAVIYADAVHRKDAGGQWQNIDNRLYLSQDSKSNTEAYRTTDGRTSFAKSYAANQEIFSLSEDGYAVSVSMISNQLTLEPIVGGELVTQAAGTTAAAATSTVTVTNAPTRQNAHATEWASIEAALESVGGDDGSITYTNVTSNTDLEYVLQGNVIRGKIVVNSRALSYVYRLKLDIEGLTPILTNSGSVSLCDADNIERLVIPAPYMYDANGTISYDVTYGLTTNADGTYTLTVTADPTWINNIGRILPVTIDVTLTTPEEHIDTYVAKDQPDEYFEYSPVLIAGYGSSSNQEYVTLIRMPYINTIIPPTYEITSASLAMTYSIVAGGYTVVLDCHQITSEWNASEIKWSDYADGLDYATASSGTTSLSGSFTNTTFDLTTLAQGWHEERYPNYGFLLKANSSSSQCPAYFTTASAPPEAAAYYPVVTIEYAPTIRDGVYALKNVGNTNMWMSVDDNSILPSASVIQRELTTSPVTSCDRGALFKISNVQRTDRYVIRCMTNNMMGLGFVSGQIKTVALPASDNEVPSINCFRIHVQDDDKIVIESYYVSQLYLSAPDNTALAEGDTPNMNIGAVVGSGNLTERARWTIEMYEAEDIRYGFDILRPAAWLNAGGIDVGGGSGTASCAAWSTKIGVNMPFVGEVTPEILTVSLDDSNLSMAYNPEAIGTANLTAGVQRAVDTEMLTLSLDIPVVPSEGEYFLQNMESKQYIHSAGPHTGSYAYIYERSFIGSNQQQWIVEHVPYENGYVRLKSAHYSDMYIGTDETGTWVRQCVSTGDDTLWRFEQTATENAKLVNKASGKVLSSNGWSATGDDLSTETYTADSAYWDEWEVIIIGAMQYVELEGQQESQWCWVTAARMFVKNYYSPITKTQAQAVEYVKGSVVNASGYVYEAKMAMDYYVSEFNEDGFTTTHKIRQIYSEEVLQRFLSDGHVIYILRGWYPNPEDSTIRTSGHMVLIIGYVYIDNQCRFIVQDPLPEDVGATKICSYQYLVNGSSVQDGDIGIWEETLVVTTDYAHDTIPYYFWQ